jgi:hypothetical protein
MFKKIALFNHKITIFMKLLYIVNRLNNIEDVVENIHQIL